MFVSHAWLCQLLTSSADDRTLEQQYQTLILTKTLLHILDKRQRKFNCFITLHYEHKDLLLLCKRKLWTIVYVSIDTIRNKCPKQCVSQYRKAALWFMTFWLTLKIYVYTFKAVLYFNMRLVTPQCGLDTSLVKLWYLVPKIVDIYTCLRYCPRKYTVIYAITTLMS